MTCAATSMACSDAPVSCGDKHFTAVWGNCSLCKRIPSGSYEQRHEPSGTAVRRGSPRGLSAAAEGPGLPCAANRNFPSCIIKHCAAIQRCALNNEQPAASGIALLHAEVPKLRGCSERCIKRRLEYFLSFLAAFGFGGIIG